MELGAGADVLDLGDGDEIVDSLAIVLQVEAGVLQSYRKLDDGLPDFVDLLMGRDLLQGRSAAVHSIFSRMFLADRDLQFARRLGQDDG